MNWLAEPFHYEFMQRALLACALIGFTNGYLSGFIVLRRLALMADALSHSLLPGLAVGILLFGFTPISLFAGGLVAAMLVALGSEIISRSSRIKEETALAVLFTLAFSAGIVLLSLRHVAVNLEDYLLGNLINISDSDLWITYSVSLVILPALVALQRPLLVMVFEPSVARSQGVPVVALNYLLVTFLVLAMISSFRAVGVILALGLLVAPAATIYLFSDSCPALFWGGGIVGAVGSCLGLLLSYWLRVPPGACIVLLLGLVFFAAYICSPRYGIFRHLFTRRHLHEESLSRWHGALGEEEKPDTAAGGQPE